MYCLPKLQKKFYSVPAFLNHIVVSRTFLAKLLDDVISNDHSPKNAFNFLGETKNGDCN